MNGTIGIGISKTESQTAILDSINRYNGQDKIVCYAQKNVLTDDGNLNIHISEDPGLSLVKDLASGNLSAALRGTLSANETLHYLKEIFNVSELERIVLLKSSNGKLFFLAPVGVDEGWTITQKISLIKRGRVYVEKTGLSKKVGILSGGRLGDIGRHEIVDRTLADAELVAKITGATHYGICIEEAIRDCGLIIAPDGISGNLIFRTLTFVGNGEAYGAPVMNIDKIFVDTSRVNPDYLNALILASSLSQ